MAVVPNQLRGVARNGKIELEPGANVPDGTEVFVTFGGQGAEASLPNERVHSKRSKAKDLLNSEIFGMWADRTDISDSAEFVRQLRDKAWRRTG